ncbi:hypothetical protein CAPTEDRAFT_205998 [Capitella teleta]|uniref:Aminotransferase class V domain-containing protein n=1 Tax=Capitella teleta TaxID=283909 RepID=R7U3V1_CAPTE|nr:hypothetical protein CAPTEDRAFT_205998 [Capitella teleta]|eukprot:ELU00669.1 hypothetical protein CAPTEDRAFT_205998 [Capitella teleta]
MATLTLNILVCLLLLIVDAAQSSALRKGVNVEIIEAKTLDIYSNSKEARNILDDAPAFGEEMRLAQFNRFEINYTFLNHGSFGAVPNQVRQKQNEMMDLRERNPNQFINATQYDLIDVARRALATFLGSAYANLILVENVTKGVSNILRSLTLAPGEAILINTFTYSSMKNAAKAMVDRSEGTELFILELEFPINSPNDVIMLYTEMLTEHPNIRIAIIDHIAVPGVMFPLRELIDLCKSHDVLTVIDGSLYKWLFGPPGSSFQWSAERHHSIVQPAVTSFYYGDPYPANFERQGTRDAIPFIVMPSAIEFFHWFGGLVSAREIQNILFDDYLIQAKVEFRHKMYIRISLMVYVTIDDCKELVDAIVDLKARQMEHNQLLLIQRLQSDQSEISAMNKIPDQIIK